MIRINLLPGQSGQAPRRWAKAAPHRRGRGRDGRPIIGLIVFNGATVSRIDAEKADQCAASKQSIAKLKAELGDYDKS